MIDHPGAKQDRVWTHEHLLVPWLTDDRLSLMQVQCKWHCEITIFSGHVTTIRKIAFHSSLPHILALIFFLVPFLQCSLSHRRGSINVLIRLSTQPSFILNTCHEALCCPCKDKILKSVMSVTLSLGINKYLEVS